MIILYGLTGTIFLTTEQYFIQDSCVKSNAQCSSLQELCVCHCNFYYVMVSGNCVKGMIFIFYFSVVFTGWNIFEIYHIWCVCEKNNWNVAVLISLNVWLSRKLAYEIIFSRYFNVLLLLKDLKSSLHLDWPVDFMLTL